MKTALQYFISPIQEGRDYILISWHASTDTILLKFKHTAQLMLLQYKVREFAMQVMQVSIINRLKKFTITELLELSTTVSEYNFKK
ncbi:hypothetical protein [Bartonella sp. CB189]|uniref:hypothetical protein n=1 Tax=Bartonella sp. CB189 TaxID=3112254 RepID=UPI002F96BF78